MVCVYQTAPPAQGAPTTRSGSTSTSTPGGAQPPAPGGAQPMTDEIFAQLVSGIGNYVSRAAMGEPANDTISDFLNQLGQRHNVVGGEGRRSSGT